SSLAAALPNCPDAPVTMILPKTLSLFRDHNGCYGCGKRERHVLSIEHRLGLQDLIANYSWALDTGDAEALVACFTEDCVMSEEVFEDPDVWEGHDGIRGLMNHYANGTGLPGRQPHVTKGEYIPKADCPL